MCERKYSEYKIVVTYLNGDKEELSYKGVNTNSYKDMMKFYKDIKQQYINESVLIDFLGVGSDGTLGVLFTKKIVTEETKQKEFADKVANTRVEDILADIRDNVKLLKERLKYCNGQQDVLNKQEDVELHKIESFHCKDWESEQESNFEKIKIFNRISNIRTVRRITKDDIKIGNQVMECIKINELNQISLGHKKHTYLDEKMLDRYKIMKEVPFRTFKEKIALVKQLGAKYNKVIVDDSNMKIVCYNKAS